jgi:hypothetical protein
MAFTRSGTIRLSAPGMMSFNKLDDATEALQKRRGLVVR